MPPTGPRVAIDRYALHAARTVRRLSQEDLARLAGVTRNTVQNLEAGRTSPRAETAARLAEALGIAVEALVGSAPQYRPNRGPVRHV